MVHSISIDIYVWTLDFAEMHLLPARKKRVREKRDRERGTVKNNRDDRDGRDESTPSKNGQTAACCLTLGPAGMLRAAASKRAVH